MGTIYTAATRTHCESGKHEWKPGSYTPERQCRACARERARVRYGDKTRATGGPGRKAEHVVEDWLDLKRQGYTLAQAADRMGMNTGALKQALYRAARRGLIDRQEAPWVPRQGI